MEIIIKTVNKIKLKLIKTRIKSNSKYNEMKI